MKPSRILVVNKATGQLEPVIDGSQFVALSAEPPLWNSIQLEKLIVPALHSPERITEHHLIFLKLDETPAQVEWRRNGRSNSHLFEKGDITYFPPGELGTWRFAAAQELLATLLFPQLFDEVAADAGASGPVQVDFQPQSRDHFVADCLIVLQDEIVSGCPGGSLFGDTVAGTLANHLLRNYADGYSELPMPRGKLPSHSLKAVMEYIRENYKQSVSLADLASLVYRSTYHFARCFKESTGLSPYQYVTRFRLQRARQVMREQPQLPLGEVAKQVGYRNARDLARALKRIALQ